MNAKRDLLIVILLMAALGVAWYYAGGTASDLARSGPLFKLPEGQTIPTAIPGVEQVAPPRSDSGDVTTTFTNYLGTFSEEVSPYAAYVSLDEGNARSSYDSEYVTIRVAYNAPQRITITGWKLESTGTGVAASIPQAAALPFLGTVSDVEPISLSAGNSVYVVTGRSPNGTSFRTNMCTGYFEQFQNFTPALKLECPNPQEEATAYLTTGNYSDECYDFVRTLGRCTLVLQSVPLSAGAQCEQFTSNVLSYSGCIVRHKTDPKFYKDDWYVYLNRDQELWRSRSERIRLVDESGKVVDVVSY